MIKEADPQLLTIPLLMEETSMQPKTWLITGTSTGLGRALTEAVLERGHNVVATARRFEEVRDFADRFPERAIAVPLDVTQEAQARDAVREAVRTYGRIDVVVNNAGYGLLGAIEETTDEQARAQFETNLFGVLNVTRAVLPVLRRQRSGRFIQISSVGGQISFPGIGIYNATKFGLEAISQSLAGELAPYGVGVTIVEPGGIRTDWAGRSMVHAEPSEAYEETVGQFRQMVAQMSARPDLPQFRVGDPRRMAEAIVAVAESEEPPLRLPLGSQSFEMIRQKLEDQRAELERWEETSRSVDQTPAA